MFLFFKSKQERFLNELKTITYEINLKEPIVAIEDDKTIRERAEIIKTVTRFRGAKEKGNPINGFSRESLVEAVALLREVAKRKLNERPYDEQIWAALSLFNGKIVEMANGEGKTLAATISVFLEYLAGNNIHLVTANDYLAKRDATWMGPIYHALGLTVGVLQRDACLVSDKTCEEFRLEEVSAYIWDKKSAYGCDVVYSTASVLAFDYLKDNMVTIPKDIVQTEGLKSAIIDEIDCILIDEARIPCSINSPGEESGNEKFYTSKAVAESLEKNKDYSTNEEDWELILNDCAIEKIERLLKLGNIYDPKLLENPIYRGILPAIRKAISAREFYKENIDYLIEDNSIVIIDETTGRPKYGNRYSDGLHQALEVKHGIDPQPETREIGVITLQKFFQKYEKMAGMTGTAVFDEEEYKAIYNRDVIVIPSRFEKKRIDMNDLIYKTKESRLTAVIDDIIQMNEKERPVLVGTLSVEAAETISKLLESKGITHELLHAKNHRKEADIIKDAGQKGAITISAKMAGRGTDIRLGSGVEELGGLHVIGVERNETRRVDEQLTGRAGRHGKIGSSQFLLSLDDRLLRIFGAERIKSVMDKLGMKDGEEIEHELLSSAIRNAQDKVTSNNFEVRKQLLKYDEVLDKHRSYIYELRRNVLYLNNTLDEVATIFDNFINRSLRNRTRRSRLKRNEATEFIREIAAFTKSDIMNPFDAFSRIKKGELAKWAKDVMISLYIRKGAELGNERLARLSKLLLLQIIDNHWQNHLENIESLKLKKTVGGYGTGDILAWYKSESEKIFDELILRIENDFIKKLFSAHITPRFSIPSPQEILDYSNGLTTAETNE